MLLLITDTSGKHGSVTLARADSESKDKVEVIESVPLAGGTFSAQLVPQIAALLDKHSFRRTDLRAFIVVSGPGSFTGLRVGLAAIKALGEVLQKPIVPVSLLEVVAIASGVRGKVMAALDAGRGEIYAGEYDVGDSARVLREQLLTKNELAVLPREMNIATPDDALVSAMRESGIPVLQVALPSAQLIAQLGWQKLRGGLSVTPEQLEANYIRRSGAEIFSKPVGS